jgi:hypothetical protein
MCIPCFQVHSVIEIGFWMVLVDHCVFADPGTILGRGAEVGIQIKLLNCICGPVNNHIPNSK